MDFNRLKLSFFKIFDSITEVQTLKRKQLKQLILKLNSQNCEIKISIMPLK